VRSLARYNFGRNIRFTPRDLVVPADEPAVLDALTRFKGRSVRVLGRLHSWSEIAAAPDVALDLRRLNDITLLPASGGTARVVRAGAGCTVNDVIEYLRPRGLTLPTVGIIGAQSIAGAIATATHGSGRSSLSHFVRSLRVAGYDAEGVPTIFDCESGTALRAARCAVGSAGVVLEVTIEAEPDMLVEESTSWFDNLADALRSINAFPLSQFYLVPWTWRWFVQARRSSSRTRPTAMALLLRLLRRIGVDLVWNGGIYLAARRSRWPRLVRALNRWFFPFIARPGLCVVDDRRHVLMMRHDLFTHVEFEIFVPESHLEEAAQFVSEVLQWCGGATKSAPQAPGQLRFSCPQVVRLYELKGRYVHDYPVTFRRVLKDDALIAMTAGEHAAWYAISLVTYQRDVALFGQLARLFASVLGAAFGARPHWGKICPLTAEEVAHLYPLLPLFRQHCDRVDPRGVFRSAGPPIFEGRPA
jgi:L-gulonolactone oxidase